MLKDAKISFNAMKKSIVLFAAINSTVYFLLVLGFKYLNLLHVFGLSLVNFVVLFFLSMLQFKLQIKKNKGYIPYLQVFFATLMTGTLSFAAFVVFLFGYSRVDPYFIDLFFTDTGTPILLMPFILLFCQGSGGSIIVALAISFYTARYEDGEVEI